MKVTPPNTYGDCAALLKQINLQLESRFQKHDLIHVFIGAPTTHEGEVLVSAFLRWDNRGRMSVKKATPLFREAERYETSSLIQPNVDQPQLNRLTNKEIERYTEYFNFLVKEFCKQLGIQRLRCSVIDMPLSNMPILNMPDG
jgi:hypothetical protein